MSADSFTHLDAAGRAHMVDVGDKPVTARSATARAVLSLSPDTLAAIAAHQISKGEVLQVARLAGIMAVKCTDELIPLCHSLGLEQVNVRFALLPAHSAIVIEAVARCTGKTNLHNLEPEDIRALTRATAAATGLPLAGTT